MLRRLDQVLLLLYRLELWASVGALLIIVLANCANLLSRWVLGNPIDWVLEISLILFVYNVMLIVPVLYRNKNFIQMHLIEEITGDRARVYIALAVETLVIAFLVYLVPLACSLSLSQIEMLSRGLGIPRVYITLPVAIGTGLCLPIGLSNFIHHLQNLRSAGRG